MGEKIKQAIQRRRSVMVQAEWRHLLQSKTLLVAVIALAFVPVIYAAFFLSSVWDPYGHTDRLPIAFVNEDKGAQINGKELQIGRTMTESLHKSKALKWEFVSKQQADDGVRRGYYYAVVTVPKDFSQRAASLRQDKPQQAVVSYQLTPAKNYIGAVISRQAAQKVKETLPELQTIASALQQTKAIAEQTQSLLANLDTLTKTLATQQQTLKNGVAALNTGVEQFTPQATTAFAGYNTVRAGGERLQAGAALVAGNLATAQQGSGQLAQGAATLQQHSSTLVQASNQLVDGSSTLAHKLQTGAAQVKLLPTSPAAQQQMAAPVASSEHSTGSVPNYGYAMAPYMLSLALFVGGLALTTMYPVRKTFSRQENAWRWWLAKMSVLGLAALVQATIMMLVLVYVVGLQPDHPWLFAATSYLASLAFMSLITLVVMVLDNPGRLVVMIIMVLQLAASEGIFPIQTASGFFQAINPWLPMTHSIIAYRHAISGGVDSALYTQHMLILAGFALVANALLIGFLAWRGTRQFAHTTVDGD